MNRKSSRRSRRRSRHHNGSNTNGTSTASSHQGGGNQSQLATAGLPPNPTEYDDGFTASSSNYCAANTSESALADFDSAQKKAGEIQICDQDTFQSNAMTGGASISIMLEHNDDDNVNSDSFKKNYTAMKRCERTYISHLPDDVFFLIFQFLQPADLCCVCCVNRRFRYLASKDSVWLAHARKCVLVQPVAGLSSRMCSVKELCRFAPNWKKGRFKEGFSARHRNRLIPWVRKDENDLWFSSGNVIRCFKTQPRGFPTECRDRNLVGMMEDVSKFTVKKNMVVGGCRDGSVFGWDTTGCPLFHFQNVHRSETHCVDFTDNIVISGARDGTCKIVSLHESSSDGCIVQTFDAGERVWSLEISPCEIMFAAGLAGDFVPAIIWDIESGNRLGDLGVNHRMGAGVLDLMFESPHELLTCGYDTFLRMWDLRTMTCVRQWEEPYDSALYCVTTDGGNSMAVGTARHGMVRLWDKRKSEPVQVYYSHQVNSPVYGLAMDYGHLYLALDKGLNVMNFTI
ncbi:F-box/WD repeat-containing protein 4 [Aplysia californica]|uniref:F-box/WD repeat-containing protein 4 n=1 Tax=Aplysia californica TaxID=6500 RepID=A0ABM0JGK2_APLCA|nr:F-box/WD repeat-containing protein 4 [Aplysia californica]